MLPAFCARISGTRKTTADGFFSGWDDESRAYYPDSWLYEGEDLSSSATRPYPAASALRFSNTKTPLRALHARDGRKSLRHSAGAFPEGGRRARHGVRPGENGRDLLRGRLDAAFQRRADHSHGCDPAIAPGQYRAAGGGILALRGHASIQGSTDIPTLYDILPGYLTMPTRGQRRRHA